MRIALLIFAVSWITAPSFAADNCPVDDCSSCENNVEQLLEPHSATPVDSESCHIWRDDGKLIGCRKKSTCTKQESYQWTYACGKTAGSSTHCGDLAEKALKKDCPRTSVSCHPFTDTLNPNYICTAISSCRPAIQIANPGFTPWSGYYCPKPTLVTAGSMTGGHEGSSGLLNSRGADFYFCSPDERSATSLPQGAISPANPPQESSPAQ